jgi:hypothetical protein
VIPFQWIEMGGTNATPAYPMHHAISVLDMKIKKTSHPIELVSHDASSVGHSPLGQAVGHYRAEVRRKVQSTVSIADGKVQLRDPSSTKRKFRA